MAKFTKRTTFDITKVFDETGGVVVTFANSDEGRRAYGLYTMAVTAHTRDELYDEDLQQYVVGPLDKLVREG